MVKQSSTPTPAQIVRDFLCYNRSAVLSTHSSSESGYPFGSVVPYDIDAAGRLLIFISRISEHFRNLQRDPKACLFTADSSSGGDPQPFARASVLGDCTPVPEAETAAVQDSYWKRFPESPSRSLAHDFVFYRCTPHRIRWIGGFGDIRWISAEQYAGTRHDPVAYSGREISSHVNRDHRDALSELAAHHHGIAAVAAQCELVGATSSGLTIQVAQDNSLKRIFVAFHAPAQSPAALRDAMIALLAECRSSEAS